MGCRTAIVGTLLLLAALLPCCSGETPRPFLLLLTVDTLRADRLASYGAEITPAPHLDSLLEASEVFRFAYSPAPYTLPSVAALLTGRYPEELGVRGNVSRVGSDFATVAGVLRLHGWRTAATVSNYVLRSGGGFERGFEVYDASFPQLEANREMPERIAADTTDAALAVVDPLLASTDPIFLWVHYQDPHGPYLPPPGRRERYLEAERTRADGERALPVRHQRGLGAIPLYQYVEGQREPAFYRAGYDGEVSYLDDQIQRLLQGLGTRGLLSGATIVFTADHGEALGEGDYWFAHGEYLSDPQVRVPLAIRVPGRGGAVRSDPASLVDVFPTLLGLAGIAVPPGYPGRDLLAEGAEAATPEIYLATLGGSTVPRFGLVSGGYKYLVNEEPEGPREELDRLEGLAPQGADPELSAMRERLEHFRSGLSLSAREQTRAISAAERERLRQLGYLSD